VGRILIRGGRILDPVTDRDARGDLLIEDGRIAAVENAIEATDAEIVDAEGCWVAPGLVDLHTHLREPGQEYKEDIGSGGRAAVAGGFTAVACMANTNPVNDDPSLTDYILDRARQDSPARVYPIAAATKGLAGEVMTEMVALVEAGAVAFSDDGMTIMDSAVQRRVLEYSRLVEVPVIVHAEDRSLVGKGVVNEGPISTRLGLPPNPAVAEIVQVARDLMLAELTGAHLHVAEATPHHLALTDEAVLGFDTNTKMAPPLRSAADVKACRQGLIDGTIDAVATDHAPHAVHEKEVEFTTAPFGVLGLETALSVLLDLVRDESLTPVQLIRRLTVNPARILNKEGGRLDIGAPADVVVIDPERSWTYDPYKGYSKSRNSPWAGETLQGRAVATIVAGRLVYDIDRGILAP
jgi:dihydroorotase